jgi:hypothetical protein
MRVEAERQ